MKKILITTLFTLLLTANQEINIITEDTTVQSVLNMSNGKSVLLDTQDREGVVIRRYDNDRISFKAKNPQYLLSDN